MSLLSSVHVRGVCMLKFQGRLAACLGVPGQKREAETATHSPCTSLIFHVCRRGILWNSVKTLAALRTKTYEEPPDSRVEPMLVLNEDRRRPFLPESLCKRQLASTCWLPLRSKHGNIQAQWTNTTEVVRRPLLAPVAGSALRRMAEGAFVEDQ